MYKKSRFVVILLQQLVMALAILGALIPTLMPDYAVFLRVLWVLAPLMVIWVLTPFCKRYYQIVLLHLFLAACCVFIAGGRAPAFDSGIISQGGVLFLVGTAFSFGRMLIALLTLRDAADDATPRLDSIRLIMPVFLFFPAVWLAARHQVLPWYRTFYNLLFSSYLILLFVRLFLTRSAEFAEAHRHTSQMPLGQISRVNHRILLVFLAAAAVLFFLMPLSHLEAVILWIPQLLLALLRWLFSLLPRASNDVSDAGTFNIPRLPGYEDSSGNTVLAVIGEILAGIVLAVIAAAALLALYRFLTSRIRRIEDQDLDVKEFIGAQERAEKAGGAGMESLAWYDFSPSGRARRAWIRELLSRRKKNSLRPSQSPEELEETAGLPKDTALHSLYEKARYSENGITREEWENR